MEEVEGEERGRAARFATQPPLELARIGAPRGVDDHELAVEDGRSRRHAHGQPGQLGECRGQVPAGGVALFEAAVAQGIAGMLARQRTSPYLPGVRSRLWRFVAADPGVGAALNDPGPPVEGPAAAPVIALISRLPLDED